MLPAGRAPRVARRPASAALRRRARDWERVARAADRRLAFTEL